MDNATVRVRPLRFAFVVEPKDKAGLQRIFETNSALWGGVFNFIVPLFKQVPQRYRENYFKTIPAKAMLKGLVEAFQPDYVVELKPGAAASYGITFPEKRILAIEDLSARDERKRCKIGIDLRSISDDLYRTAFRFVQRHPPEVVIPSPTEKRFRLLFAATFGFFPESGPLADVSDIFLKALEGKRTVIKAAEFPKLFGRKYYCPLHATNHELDTFRNSWEIDSKLFYMDETSPWDLIEFWNLRALGWHIEPLPVSLAPDLIDYCNDFIRKVYRPFPPPSNAYHHATILCARSQSVEKLQEFMKKLTWVPNTHAALDHRFPRIWEEWGRSADHAEPQTVEHSEKTVDAHVLGGGLDIRTQPHDFAKEVPVPLNDPEAVIHRCDWEDLAVLTIKPDTFGPMLEFFDIQGSSVDPADRETVVGVAYPVSNSVILNEGRIGPVIQRAVVLSPTPFNGAVLPSATGKYFGDFDPARHYLIPYELAKEGKHPRGISGAAVWVESSEEHMVWAPRFKLAGICTSCYRDGAIEQIVKASVVRQFLLEVFGEPEK